MSRIVYRGNSIDYLEIDGEVVIGRRSEADPLERHHGLVSRIVEAFKKVGSW